MLMMKFKERERNQLGKGEKKLELTCQIQYPNYKIMITL